MIINYNMFLIDFIGYYSPFSLIILNLVLGILFKIDHYFLYLILFGNIFNCIVSHILKLIFKVKRQKQRPFMGTTEKSYAFPSGHSQIISFNTTLIALLFKNIYLTLFAIILCFNTFYQRYNYRNHTIIQIVVGAVIGIFLGFSLHNFVSKEIKKNNKVNKNNLNK